MRKKQKAKLAPTLSLCTKINLYSSSKLKNLVSIFQKSDFRSGKTQLAEYLNQIGNVRWGMLTNGVEWKLFDFSQTQYGGIEISAFDLKSEGDVINVTKKAVEEQCYEFFDFHEVSYTESSWPELSKRSYGFFSGSLSKAILSVDVVRYIAKFVRGEHEFKANHEILTDRLYWLFRSKALMMLSPDGMIRKLRKFIKYVKAQKRASRKTKKSKRDIAHAAEVTPPSTDVETEATDSTKAS